MSAVLTKAITKARILLAERQKRAKALPPISIQFGGTMIPALPGTETIHFEIRPAAREIKITRGTEEPLHSNHSARLT